jgi:hypothetical protein
MFSVSYRLFRPLALHPSNPNHQNPGGHEAIISTGLSPSEGMKKGANVGTSPRDAETQLSVASLMSKNPLLKNSHIATIATIAVIANPRVTIRPREEFFGFVGCKLPCGGVLIETLPMVVGILTTGQSTNQCQG